MHQWCKKCKEVQTQFKTSIFKQKSKNGINLNVLITGKTVVGNMGLKEGKWVLELIGKAHCWCDIYESDVNLFLFKFCLSNFYRVCSAWTVLELKGCKIGPFFIKGQISKFVLVGFLMKIPAWGF